MPRKSPHTHVPKSLLHCLQQFIATTTKAAPTPVLRAGRMRTACSVGGGRGGENVSQKPALLAAFLPPARRPRDVTPPATFLCRKRWFASAPLRPR